MSKFYFFLLIFFYLPFAMAQSDCKITKDSVVLFIDANDSPREIVEARAAACARGERLVVVEPSQMKDGIKQLAGQNTPISSLIASGHDGGGSFYGFLGSMSKSEIVQALHDGYKGKEEMLNRLEGLFLWGCYTSVPDEVAFWRSSFPNLKFLVGFHGAGPSNTNISGLRMLKDSLIKQGQICDANTEQQLRQAIRGINSLTNTLVGAYAHSCKLDEEYYYMQDYNYETNGVRSGFGKFDDYLDCSSLTGEYSRNNYIFRNYYSGLKDIPEQTTGTDLRNLYSLVRQNAQCFNDGLMNGDRIGNLLFFHDVKKNFGKVFEQDIAEAMSELDELAKDVDIIKGSFFSSNKELDDLKKTIKDVKGNFWMPTEEEIGNKSRREVLANIKRLSSVTNHLYLNSDDGKKLKLDKLKNLENKMERYLHNLDPECMDFLDWHEYLPEHTPKPLC